MNGFVKFLKKVGHVSETVGKDALQVGAVASPFLPIPAPVATAIRAASEAVPGNLGAENHSPVHDVLMIAGNVVNSPLGDTMNPLEQFAVTIVLGVLNTVVKNPAHKAALQNQLLGVADDIYLTYGMTPPTRTAAVPSGQPTA